MGQKEREEFAKVKVHMEILQDDVKDIKYNLKDFIKECRNLFATKESVCTVEEKVNNLALSNGKWVRWGIPLAVTISIAVMGIIFKILEVIK